VFDDLAIVTNSEYVSTLLVSPVLLISIACLTVFVSYSDDIFVVADKNRITQVISNLLDNALKFTSKSVASVVVARKKKQKNHQEEAIVTVENTDPGIHPEIFPKLFAKFSSKSFSGTGLGLYISKIGVIVAGKFLSNDS